MQHQREVEESLEVSSLVVQRLGGGWHPVWLPSFVVSHQEGEGERSSFLL